MNNIGETIKNLRIQKGLTQDQLGKATNSSGVMIGQYERGIRKPKIETLKKIAAALEVEINYFLSVDDLMQKVIEERQNEGFKSLIKELKELKPSEAKSIFDPLLTTVEYISRAHDDEISELSQRLGRLILSYGDMLLASWEMTLGSANKEHDYIVFLNHYERCVRLINEHKEYLINGALNSMKDNSKLRELIYGKDSDKGE